MIKENDAISRVLLTIDQFKTVDKLKTAVRNNDYNPQSSFYCRSLIWKACLILDNLNLSSWDDTLYDSRAVYHQLIQRADMAVPWDHLPTDNTFYVAPLNSAPDANLTPDIAPKLPVESQTGTSANALSGTSNTHSKSLKRSLFRTSASFDPLKPSGSRISTERYSSESVRSALSGRPILSSQAPPLQPGTVINENDVELLSTIILDIDRLFPGELFFNEENPSCIACKRSIVEILYIWSKCNPKIGYKQGIHEIMGLIYMNLYEESAIIPNTNTLNQQDLSILNLLNRDFVKHDCFTIFNKFIVESTIIWNFYETEENLWSSIEKFNSNLMKIDQLIHYNLINKIQLESQLWIIRYLRLLLLRELGDLNTTCLLWDKLISSSKGNSLQLLPDLIIFMIIQLLIQIKSELITSDFAESISLLLHYPIENSIKNDKQATKFISNLYSDAMNLYERRNDDLQLYEYGIKMNAKFNPDMKVSISYNGKTTKDTNKVSTMKMEKTRLEMRLKKKAQQLLNK